VHLFCRPVLTKTGRFLAVNYGTASTLVRVMDCWCVLLWVRYTIETSWFILDANVLIAVLNLQIANAFELEVVESVNYYRIESESK